MPRSPTGGGGGIAPGGFIASLRDAGSIGWELSQGFTLGYSRGLPPGGGVAEKWGRCRTADATADSRRE